MVRPLIHLPLIRPVLIDGGDAAAVDSVSQGRRVEGRRGRRWRKSSKQDRRLANRRSAGRRRVGARASRIGAAQGRRGVLEPGAVGRGRVGPGPGPDSRCGPLVGDRPWRRAGGPASGGVLQHSHVSAVLVPDPLLFGDSCPGGPGAGAATDTILSPATGAAPSGATALDLRQLVSVRSRPPRTVPVSRPAPPGGRASRVERGPGRPAW